MVPIFKRIAGLRIDNDLTQNDIAKVLNISRSKYSKIEVGILDFDLETLSNFVNYFKVNIDYIYELSNNKDFNYHNNINLKIIGNNIKEIRKTKKLSQEKICHDIGFSQSAYSRFELGNGITGYKLYLLAKYFNVSMDDLIEK